MKISAVIIALAGAAAVSASTLADLVVDLNALNSSASDLFLQLNGTDGYDLSVDLDIDEAAQILRKQIDLSTKDVKKFKGVITNIDTEGAILLIRQTANTTKSICKRLAQMRKAFQSVGATQIVTSDVANISASIDKFGPALVALAPKASQANATALYQQFQADLAICAKYYPVDVKH